MKKEALIVQFINGAFCFYDEDKDDVKPFGRIPIGDFFKSLGDSEGTFECVRPFNAWKDDCVNDTSDTVEIMPMRGISIGD